VIGKDGKRYDFQLKGAGPPGLCPRGDGRFAPSGPVCMREYVVSEADGERWVGPLHARSAAVTTAVNRVMREGLLTRAHSGRISSSHIRIGLSVVRWARTTLRRSDLADHVIAALPPPQPRPERALGRTCCRAVIGRSGSADSAVANKLALFPRGDEHRQYAACWRDHRYYGPCAFMDNYHPDRGLTDSVITPADAYAYANQPGYRAIGTWPGLWPAPYFP